MDDGTVIERIPYQYPASVYGAEGAFLEAYSHLASVEAQRITYLSDGLRIQGFQVNPPGEGPFPCVIYNRGGNREFGSIGDPVMVNLLCRIAS
jgi:hypothetical protein